MSSDITAIFQSAPTVQILHWLVQGNLASSMSRAARFWVILGIIYRDRLLPDLFRYPDLRDRLYSQQHPTSEKLKAESFANGCGDRHCIWGRYRIRVKTCKMTFKAMQGVDFKNMIFLVFWAKKLTIECAFKTDLAGFYTYPVSTPFSSESSPHRNA